METHVPGWVHFAAGACGGTIGTVITCPLEVVKTRLQSSVSSTFTSSGPSQNLGFFSRSKTLQCLQDTASKEGIRGLWRGVGLNLIGVIPARSIYFSSYQFAKRHFKEWNGGSEGAHVHLASAVVAGLSTTTATNPLWLIKTRVQLTRADQGSPRGVGAVFQESMNCVKGIWQKDGFFGYYRGISASYAGEIVLLE